MKCCEEWQDAVYAHPLTYTHTPPTHPATTTTTTIYHRNTKYQISTSTNATKYLKEQWWLRGEIPVGKKGTFNEIKTEKNQKGKKVMYQINQLKHTLSLLVSWSVKLSTNQEDKTRQAHTQNMSWSRFLKDRTLLQLKDTQWPQVAQTDGDQQTYQVVTSTCNNLNTPVSTEE